MKLSHKHLRIIKNIALEQIAEGKLGGAREHEAMSGVDAGQRLLDTLIKNKLIEQFHTNFTTRTWQGGASEMHSEGFDLYRMTAAGIASLTALLHSEVRDMLQKLSVEPVWTKMPDECVRHVWSCACDDDDKLKEGEETTVGPDFYEENGEPACGNCGTVYNYVRTEVLQ